MAVLLLSGCASKAAPKTAQTLEPTDETGVIAGTITDAEIRPIVGASVGVRGTSKIVRTDASGGFQLGGLEPGAYTVDVARLGYQAAAQETQVKARETTKLDFRLNALRAANITYPVVTKFNGYYDCALGTAAWTSPCSWPYTAAFLTAKNNGVNLTNYGVPADAQDNRFRYTFPVKANATEIVTELVWTKTSAASEKLYLILGCDEYDPVADDCGDLVDEGPTYATAEGVSPLRVEWNASRIPTKPDLVMARVYLPGGIQPSVAFAQEFTIWNTVFYGGDAPDGYSALKTKK